MLWAPHVPAARSSVHPPVSLAWLDPGTSQLAWPANAHTSTHTHTPHTILLTNLVSNESETEPSYLFRPQQTHCILSSVSCHGMPWALCCVVSVSAMLTRTRWCAVLCHITLWALCCVVSVSAMLIRTRCLLCYVILHHEHCALLCYVNLCHVDKDLMVCWVMSQPVVDIVLYCVDVCHANKDQVICCVMS